MSCAFSLMIKRKTLYKLLKVLMKKYRIFFLCLLCTVIVFSFYSCCDDKNKDVAADAANTYYIGEGDAEVGIADISKEATATPLDSTVFLGMTKKVILRGDSAFLLGDRGVYLFDLKDGRLLNSYEKKGRARNEYIRIRDFDVDAVSGHIYLLCDPEKIIELSPDLLLSRSIETREGYERLAVIDGQVYLYSYYLHKLDLLHGDEKTCLMDLPTTQAWIFGKSSIFHKTDDGLLFTPEPFSTIYSINGNEIKNLVHLSYPNENKTMERMTKSELTREETLNYPFPKIGEVMVIDNMMVVKYSYGIAMRVCLIDKHNHKVIADGYQNGIFPSSCSRHSFIADYIHNVYDMEELLLDTINVKYTFTNQPATENEQNVIIKFKPLP